MLKPLRPYGALTAAIASIALTVALENVVRFSFGNELRAYDVPLYRVWERLLDPYLNYRRYAAPELNTVTSVPGATFVALNSDGRPRPVPPET